MGSGDAPQERGPSHREREPAFAADVAWGRIRGLTPARGTKNNPQSLPESRLPACLVPRPVATILRANAIAPDRDRARSEATASQLRKWERELEERADALEAGRAKT